MHNDQSLVPGISPQTFSHKVLEYLCKYFDVFIMDNNGRTPLFYACVKDQLACAALLVSIGKRPGNAYVYQK